MLRIADATIRRLAYGKDEDAANVRCLLELALDRRIGVVDQACRVTDAQKSKLRLAGRGDIKRFFDRVEGLRPMRPHAAQNDNLPELCGFAFREDATAPARRFGLFEQSSLFSKTLKTSLAEGQAAAYEASTSGRQEAAR
jgi:hypothetical protein